jgi:chromosome segregation ATPase
LARKFINQESKKGLDAKKEVEPEDEWAHLAGGEEEVVESKIETKIEAADAMEVLDRSVTFGDELQIGPKTPYDSIKEETRNAMDAAGNTGQYIRFVNKHIDNQKREIDKIKKIQEKFDHEIDLLQSNRSKIESINKKLSPKNDVKTITESLHQLLLEKGITKSKLDTLKNEIVSVEDELQQQENQIEQASEHLKNKNMIIENKVNEQKNKEELESFMKKFGLKDVSELLQLKK